MSNLFLFANLNDINAERTDTRSHIYTYKSNILQTPIQFIVKLQWLLLLLLFKVYKIDDTFNKQLLHWNN